MRFLSANGIWSKTGADPETLTPDIAQKRTVYRRSATRRHASVYTTRTAAKAIYDVQCLSVPAL